MNRPSLVLLAAFTLTAPAAAQTANPYNGKWTVSFDGRETIDLEGTVVIKDDGGSVRN